MATSGCGFGIIRKNGAATGGYSVNDADSFIAIVPLSLSAYSVLYVASIAMSLQDGGDRAWSPLAPENDAVSQIEFPGLVESITPATVPVALPLSGSINVLPPVGSRIEVFHLGATPFSLFVDIDDTMGDLYRADVYGLVATALVAAGITASVDTTTFPGESILKIAAAEEFGDKQPHMAYWLPNGKTYGYAVPGKDDAGELVTLVGDDVFFGVSEATDDTTWVFPRSLGFSKSV